MTPRSYGQGRSARIHGTRAKPEIKAALEAILTRDGVSYADWLEAKIKGESMMNKMSDNQKHGGSDLYTTFEVAETTHGKANAKVWKFSDRFTADVVYHDGFSETISKRTFNALYDTVSER